MRLAIVISRPKRDDLILTCPVTKLYPKHRVDIATAERITILNIPVQPNSTPHC